MINRNELAFADCIRCSTLGVVSYQGFDPEVAGEIAVRDSKFKLYFVSLDDCEDNVSHDEVMEYRKGIPS